MPTGGAKKKLPMWVKIAIIVGLGGILACVGVIVATSTFLKNNDKEVQGFLNSMYTSDYSAAYDYFSTELKDVQSKDVFESQARTLEPAGMDSSCTTNWTTNYISISTSTGKTKEISGTLSCDKGSFSADFKLIKQDDNYRLYSYSIQPK